MPLSKAALVKLFLAYSLWKNVQLDHADRAYELGTVSSLAHTLLYFFRLCVTLYTQRVLKWLPPNQVTYKWKAVEELAIRTINFFFRISCGSSMSFIVDEVTMPSRFLLTNTGKLCVEDVSSSQLGFRTDASQRQFGNLECSGVFITLDKEIKFESAAASGTFVLYYVHGGGFCFGNSVMYLAAMQRYLELLRDQFFITNVAILSIDYPLAPKVKIPFPMDLCSFTLEHLIATSRVQANKVVVAGDSAGGCIALNLAMRTRGLAGVGLFSPWIGHSLNQRSHMENARFDIIGHNGLMSRFHDDCIQD